MYHIIAFNIVKKCEIEINLGILNYFLVKNSVVIKRRIDHWMIELKN